MVGPRKGGRLSSRWGDFFRLRTGRWLCRFFVPCDALPIPFDLVRSALQRAHATGSATSEIKEFDVRIFGFCW